MKDFSHCGYVRIDNRLCARTKLKLASCNECIKFCVANAILFKNHSLAIDKNRCVNCGICYAACPNSAIIVKKDNEKLIKSTEGDLDIGCIFSNASVKVACVSRITDDVIVTYLARGENVTIKKGDCSDCVFKETLPLFDKNLKRAKNIAESLNIKGILSVEKDVAKHAHIPENNVLRRELFSIFLAQNQTNKREILKKAVDASIDKIEKQFDYGGIFNLKISNACTFCGMCEIVCTQEAIVIKKYEQSGKIYFNPSLCTGCKACIESCIQNAISFEYGTTLDLKSKAVKLIEMQKNVCKLCGKEFFSQKNEDVCYLCKDKQNKKNDLLRFLKDL